jgi:hypothetical protein
MKKLSYLMLLLVLAIVTQAAKVDDFESYTPGQMDAVTTVWKAIPTGTTRVNIETDTQDVENQVLMHQVAGGANTGFYGILSSGQEVPEGSTKTLFARFRVSNNSTDHSFGLTDVDVPAGFADFRVQVGFSWGGFYAQNGAAYTWLATVTTGWSTPFYNLWVVINNATDTYDVYMTQGNVGATVSNKLTATPFAFRSTTTNALDRVFGFANNNNDQRIWYDDIYISNGVNLSIPSAGIAFNPTPADGAINIPLNTSTLSWYTGPDPNNPANPNPAITKHYVYMREGDPNLVGQLKQTIASGYPTVAATASCAPPVTLAIDKTYYWRVDESINNSGATDPNTITGDIWSFVAVKSIPVITQQPVETRVFTTDPSAVLTCKFSSVSSATATWYRYVDGVSDSPLSTGGDIVITTPPPVGIVYTSTLQINTPEVADQGNYYCIANNPGGTAVKSNTVALVIKRLLAQYDFEGNLAPAVDSAADAPTGQGKSVAGLTEPNSLLATNIALAYVTGYNGSGQAVSLDDPNQYIDFGPTGYPKLGSLLTGIGGGLDACTILCWVKPDQVTNSLNVLNSYNDNTTTGVGFSIESNMDVRINARGEATTILTNQGRPNRPGYNIFNGQWHLIGVSWDAKAKTGTVYVDGQWVAGTTTAGTPASYAVWQRGVLAGAGRQGTPNRHLLANFFGGAIDNLRIYNYSVDANVIANEYYTVTGILPCTNLTFVGNAYNIDNTGSSYCKVDMADFAVFASNWLQSGLFKP